MNWRHGKTFLQRRQFLMESNLWSDCSFTIGPERTLFHAHKLILAMASPVFEAYFFSGSQNLERLIDRDFEDVDPQAFRKLLQFIYSDSVVMDTYTEAREVHWAATKFAMSDLEFISRRRIMDTVSTQTACNLLEYSQKVRNTELENRALELIIHHTSRVIEAPSFNEISLDTLAQILSIDELHLESGSELELIHALLNWARENLRGRPLTRQTLQEVTGVALRYLRVLTLGSREVVQEVADTTALLTDAECLAVLKLVPVPAPGRALPPPAFSACRRPRAAHWAAGHADCPPRNPPCGTRCWQGRR